MATNRIVNRPAFRIAGLQAYISGPDTTQFGRFWQTCHGEGLFTRFEALTQMQPGVQTGGVVLGVSRVEADPARRDFYYLIGVELPDALASDAPALAGLEIATAPAGTWAIFDAQGPVPDAIVAAEMFAFGQWLPTSGYRHALAPEMEVYLPGENRCEFWLPVIAAE